MVTFWWDLSTRDKGASRTMSYILIWELTAQRIIFAKIHQVVHLRPAHFILCLLHPNKKGKNQTEQKWHCLSFPQAPSNPGVFLCSGVPGTGWETASTGLWDEAALLQLIHSFTRQTFIRTALGTNWEHRSLVPHSWGA